MASPLLSSLKNSSTEIQRRRNRLRKILLESLERRELLAADLFGLDDYSHQSGFTSQAATGQDMLFTSLARQSEMSAYDITNYLDQTLGGSASADLTTRPWFESVSERYDQWSREQGLAFSYSTGLVAEGEGGLVAEGEPGSGGPRLLSVAPNSGDIFTFNNVNTLNIAPTELVFRFDGASDLNPNTLANGIRIIRAGDNGTFEPTDEVVQAGYVGLGDTNRIAVFRFASTLPDDFYRVELIGDGPDAITDSAGVRLDNRLIDSTPTDTTRDTVDFRLELGALVQAVVPQPVDRLPDGTLSPQLDKIRVYFNNDDLDVASAQNPNFYQLILTSDTIQPNDDVKFSPSSVVYDPATDMAELTFASNLDVLAGGVGTFRLRIGQNDEVISTTNLPPTKQLVPLSPADPGSTISASNNLGVLNAETHRLINQNIVTTSAAALPLNFPGSNFEPGHRDIQDENHLGGGADANPQITTAFYNFALDRSYGTSSGGAPVFTSITPDQMQRVREIFEFYSAQSGMDFIESKDSGMTFVVGDLFPNGGVNGTGTLGIASVNNLNGLAILDGSITWDGNFGGNFMVTAMHEIGHMLGMVHDTELPAGTFMRGAGPGTPADLAFPGDHDVTHLQFLHRPDNRDVDLYRFEVLAGTTGNLKAEVLAERLANSSNLDSQLTLFKQNADGTLDVVSANDDYFGEDAFLDLSLTGGIYFLGVTASGNEDYNPLTGNNGSGGTSQGLYQLRFSFTPDVITSIVDTSGDALDGDGDGHAGGNFNFWFRTATPASATDAANAGRVEPRTFYVDKGHTGTHNGSPTQPFNNLDFNNQATLNPAERWPVGTLKPGDIIRVVGDDGFDDDLSTTADNKAYEIGRGGVGNAILSDGIELKIPREVTLMIDAGAIFKLQGSRIVAGSSTSSVDNQKSSIQVLGTTAQSVLFTSYDDESLGVDTNPLPTVPQKGNWGGIDIHNDIDRNEGRVGYEQQGIFLNYIANADLRYGGGRITVATPSPTVSPIQLSEARPTLINNRISLSADSAISADPNSFENTQFNDPRYQRAFAFAPDYERIGPDIRGNTLFDNSINGLFVRIPTLAGNELQQLTVSARFNDVDIPHVLGENVIINGTPGGSYLETVGPDVSLVQVQQSAGGSLSAGNTFRYRVTFVDRFGGESVASVATNLGTVDVGGAIRLTNLPAATGDFIGRRIYRSSNGGGGLFTLVAELDAGSAIYVDQGGDLGISLTTGASLQRARPDASLAIDPGTIVKTLGSRIEVGMGAQLLAEGTPQNKVIFTSRYDDRYGAGGTFDTNNDGTAQQPAPGDWGGLLARHLSTISVDSAYIAFGGGTTTIPGGFAGFNAIEVHQAEGRIANTVFEQNANGLGGSLPARDGRGTHTASVIFVRASQPVISDNIFLDNQAAVISVDANSMNAVPVQDLGRQTGDNDRRPDSLGNMGPLVKGNRLLGNSINGMEIRGAVLTTESVWDDTDIVHVLRNEITVDNFHTFGGLRLQSHVDESLVVKLAGNNAGITASGTPLDIPGRIGGSVQIIGTPGFPVVLTSLSDDSVGAGFDPTGAELTDTNNNGPSVGAAGAWRSLLFEQFSNDRNLDTLPEVEADQIQDAGVNDNVLSAQFLGGLAGNLNGGDENLRLGMTIHGVVASPSDTDVYSFTGISGTPVWLDVDRTDNALDSVVELVDGSGRIVALSNNSLQESAAGAVTFIDGTLIDPLTVQPLDRNAFAPQNTRQVGSAVDFQSVNPSDAGLRVVLPGTAGEQNTYYVRVRSSNVGPGQPASRLSDPTLVDQGITTGAYRLQIRLQQQDEVPGSTVRYADIRFAQTGVDVSGLPAHSPLLGSTTEAFVNGAQNNDPGLAPSLGNLAASDRGSYSLAGDITANAQVDFYRFSVSRLLTQSGGAHISATFDIDYASDFGRANTTLWVYQVVAGGYRLVLTGTDSNIADDRAAPGQAGGDIDNLLRGSFGSKDAYIGTQELPDGDYIVAVSNNSMIAQEFRQFQEANPSTPLVRIEPIDSIQRIVTDRFDNPNPNHAETWLPPKQVAFSTANLAGTNAVPFTLADVTTFEVHDDGNGSRLIFVNAMTGAKEAESNTFARVNDVAMSPDGRLVAYVIPTTGNTSYDSTNGEFILIDPANNGATTSLGNSGIQTFTTELTAVGPPPVFTIQPRTKNGATQGDGMQFHALSFYSNATEVDTGNLRLFGVGKRSPGFTTFARFAGQNNFPTSTFGEDTNIVYGLNPQTGAAINPAGVASRTGNARTNGAGTNIVEFGSFATASTASIVTGLAQVGSRLVAVSDAGEFFVTGNIGTGTAGFGSVAPLTTVLDPANGQPLRFTSLESGPDNILSETLGVNLSNIVFGTTANGTIWAMDLTGTLQPIFPGGHVSTKTTAAANVSGVAFSPLDVNLWHVTDTQGDVDGHGRNATFDLSRPTDQNAASERALYFGFEKAATNTTLRQAGDWDPIHSVFDNGYNLPGGAHGAIESLPIDLRGYAAEDLPTLYFTYLLDTENRNSDLNDNIFMRDALRVYVAGDDGEWVQVVTNNSANDGNLTNGRSELDSGNYGDPNFGLQYQVQEAYDVGDNAAPNSWRQARVALGQFAGNREVKIRFEFSTGATFRTGNSQLGGVELNAIAGFRLEDGDGFTITQAAQLGGARQRFEFDMGLVLNLPGGSSLTAGTSSINFNGTPLVFGTDIPFLPTDSPAQIATRVAAVATGLGFNVATNSERGNVINITNAPVGTYSTNLPFGTIQGLPGVAGGSFAVPVSQAMTTTEVRDAIRTALAAALNEAGQETNEGVWPIFGSSTIRMFQHTVTDTGPLSTAVRAGDAYGVQNGTFANMDERAQSNAGNIGVFIDDILIGLAERGEMVTATATTTAQSNGLFTTNLQYEQNGFSAGAGPLNEIERGKYQLEIRTSADYGLQSGQNIDLDGAPFQPSRSFDSNHRFAQQLAIQVAGAGQIADGDTFTLSDGVNLVTFEFDVTNSFSDPTRGLNDDGNVSISINADDSTAEVADKIRTAINTSTVQSRINVSAAVNGERTSTINPSDSAIVMLHGPAGLTRLGGTVFTGTGGLTIIRFGTESGFGEDLGDENRLRDQGMLLVASSTIRNSRDFGIEVDAAQRNAGDPSFPGGAVNFPTDNPQRLAPGAVIMNNILANNGAGGILISGDPNLVNQTVQAEITRPSTITRVVNNTIFGTRNGDTGILVNEDAAPIILNNIIANTSTAINVATANSNRVVGGTLYHNNASQPVLTGESFRIVASASPFVNAASGFYYPAPNSPAIDSSIEALPELAALTQVKNALALPLSPILAPDRDFTGQRRVDDFNVAPPGGLGANAFKDRGAVERADVTNLSAVILQPQDNDSLNVDKDRNSTYIRLSEGRLDFFSILLDDQDGVGPDETTVTASNVVLTENGQLLVPGVDYVFGFNSNSRTIRLTPLAGIWRNDSVYEITLNNKNSHRVNMPDGDTLTDGQSITVNYPGGALVYEFDNDGTVAMGSTALAFEDTDTAYELAARLSYAVNSAGVGVTSRLEGDGSLMIDGATSVTTTSAAVTSSVPAIRDLAGNPLFANRATGLTQFTIVMPEARLDFGDASGTNIPTIEAPITSALNGNGARHALLPIDVPLLALGAFADPDVDGQPTASALGDDNDAAAINLGTLATQGSAGPIVLSVPAAAGLDGQSLVITDTANRPFVPITFEFDSNGSATPTATHFVVTLTGAETAAGVASKLAAEIYAAVLAGKLTGLTPVASGSTVSLGGSATDQIDLSLAPAVARLAVGNVEAVIAATPADGQSLTINDGAGNSLVFELNDTSAIPPANSATLGTVAVDVDLTTATRDDVALALATAINAQVAARTLLVGPAVANGPSVTIVTDDEDGVSFGAVFNSASNPVPITVTASGAGMLDAWIDWNADGDFTDAGEKLFATSTPVSAGDNVFEIQTPAGAAIGFTTARFRLSALGGLLTNGIGIGGEVEDHLIEVVAGNPPVGNSDSYTVDEDNTLTVTAAAGVLSNDTDADVGVINPGVNIYVYDQDPSTAAIEPLVTTANGTLTLNVDGSFTYEPDLDFNGMDTFVYNVTDERLIGNVPVTVTITVNPINDAPLAIDDSRTTLEDRDYVRSGSEFTANDLPHALDVANEAHQVLTLVNASVIDYITTDLGAAGVAATFTSQPGQGVYGTRIAVSSQDLGSGTPATVTVTPGTITVVLNSNGGTPVVNDLLNAINNTPAAAALVAATLDAGTGAEDILAFDTIVVPPRAGVATVAGNVLTFDPVAQYNSQIGGPVLILLTIEDDGTAGPVANLTSTSTLTLTINPVNDSPQFTMNIPAPNSEDVGLVSIPNFLSGLLPGPALATDEGTGPAIVSESQNVSYEVTALNPDTVSLYKTLPAIDAAGTLTYELADDVNRITPFPALLVTVKAIDDGVTGNTSVLTNTFNPAHAFPSTPNIYDGATLTVVDTAGNTVVFELNDEANFPGVGTTAGIPHVAVEYDTTTTQTDLSQLLVAAVNAPPAASVNPNTTPWAAGAYIDRVTGEIKFTEVASVTPATVAMTTVLDNVFTALAAGQSYDGATFTITDANGDRVTFEFNDTTDTAPATPGVKLGNVAIDYDPTMTQSQLSQAISDAINAPPASAIFEAWDVMSTLSGDRLRLTGVTSLTLSASTATIINPLTSDTLVPVFATRASNESVTRTFTILHEAVNDAPYFDLGPTPVSLEDEGLITVPSFMTDIRRGPVTALDELVQTLTISYVYADNSAWETLPTIDLLTGTLTYKTAANANRASGHDFGVTVTVMDNGGTAVVGHPALLGVDQFTRTFTVDVVERNDASVFTIPSAITDLSEVVPNPADPVVIPGFVTAAAPAPGSALDEPLAPESQAIVSYKVTALKPSLFSIQPTIDANGELRYRLADDVNEIMPFPTILVEVIAVDNGAIGNGSVIVNHFDPSHAHPFLPNVYDGATLTVTDTNGNVVVFELDDAANLPGVGSTAGVPNVAIPYSASDTFDQLNQRIADTIDSSGPVGWTVNAYADAFSKELRFTGETSVVASVPAGVTILQNLFPALGAGESYEGATITLTDVDGDSITFEFNDTGSATPGVAPGHVAIDYTSATTANELSVLLDAAINNPPAALAASWDVVSTLPAATDRLQLTNVVNVKLSTNTATIINPLSAEIVSAVFTERLANETQPQTFTIVPDPINDAPEFTITQPTINDIKEDAGVVTIPDFIVDARPGPITALDELALQSITFTLTANQPDAFYNHDGSLPGPSGLPALTFNTATGNWDLTFRTAQDVNSLTGDDLGVRVVLRDDGGVRPGTPDDDETEATFDIVIDPINDAPTFVTSSNQVTVLEDNEDFPLPGATPTVIPGFGIFTVGPTTALDETTTISGVMQSPVFNTLSVSNPTLFEVQPIINAAGDLVFTTRDHQNGSAVVVVRMTDTGPDLTTGNGDDNQARPDRTFTITLTPINDHPEFQIAKTATSREDQGLVQIPGFLDNMRTGPLAAGDEIGQIFTVHVEPVDPSVVWIVAPEIAADGTLRYQTGPDVNNNNADLRVRVWLTDDGLDSPAPNNNTSPTQTFLLNVTPVNDAPTFALPAVQVTIDEDSGPYTATSFASSITVGPATAVDESAGSTANPALGSTTVAAQTVNFQVVAVSAPELFSVQPSISPTGTLTFTPGLHKNGNSIVIVRLVDSGPSAPPPNDNDSNLQTFTISINPINDAPEFVIPATITVAEDAGLVSRNGFATNVRRGPVGTDDENNQTIQFMVQAVNSSMFTTQPTIAVDGTLVFQTAPNVNSLNTVNADDLVVEVWLVDSGLGTPPPNDNTSDIQRFTISITPVNDDPIPDSYGVTILEDTPKTISAAEVLLGDVAGPTSDETDGSQNLRMSQIERTTAAGGQVTPVFDGTGPNASVVSFTYTPPANFAGTDTILYVVTDDGNPNRSGTGTVTITLEGVNDPPQFIKGPNQFATEDSGEVTVDWAMQVLAGPPAAADENDGSQTVTFSVTGDLSLFEGTPTVASDGKLTFKPAANANGTAVLSVVATDDGAPPASSTPQFLTISISAVNDAPVFTSGGNVTVNEDSGPYSNTWATQIAPAAGLNDVPATAQDEAGQIVDFNVTVDRPGLFSVQPTISGTTGILQFTPTENAFGQAVVVVTAVDRGPAGGLNVNTSQPVTFTITLTPQNDAPVGVADEYVTNENTVLQVPAAGLLSNDSDVDLPADTLSVVGGTIESAFGATVTINADGSFTYDPSAVTSIQQLTTGQNVLDSFTYMVQDATGQRSSVTVVSINVSGVDDPPIANNDVYSIGVGQTRLLDVLANDSDIDSAIDLRTIVISQPPVFGTAIRNETGVVQYIAGAGFRGIDTFGYRVRDLAGNLSNEATVTVTVNNAPVANNDSTFTFKNESIDINVLANDTDFDGTLNPSTVEVVVSPTPAGTTEVLPGGIIRFTPETGFAGQVQFSYTVADDVGTTSNVANVLVRVQNSKWQNPEGSLDVNGDGFVSPIDALLLINYLNSGAETFLPLSGVTPPPYLDPSGDESISPVDTLLVINFLNSRSGGGEGEGEADVNYALMVSPEQMVAAVGTELVRDVQTLLDDTRAAALAAVDRPGDDSGNSNLITAGDHENQDDDDLVDMLTCSRDEFKKRSVQAAVDGFFSEIGPRQH
ncbi:MAG: tandem-95 repeat protein [Pirellulaceae bacterium]